MKSLENFKNEKVELKTIWGGEVVQTTRPATTDPRGCTTTYTDSFDDLNGDGKHNGKEVYSICAEIKCE